MASPRLPLLCCAALLFLRGACYGSDVDFELAAHQSYRTALANAVEREYVEGLLGIYADSLAVLLPGWADTYALLSTNMPASGRPHQDRVVGLCGGMGEFRSSGVRDLSLRLLDEGVGTIADLNLFATIAVERLGPRLARSRLRDADVTVTFNLARLTGFEDVRMSWGSLGLALRQPIAAGRDLLGRWLRWSGASASLGLTYSRLTGREDVGHGFYSDVGDDREPLDVVVDPDGGGTVTVSAPDWGGTAAGIVHYPFVEFNALALQTSVRGYLNVLGALDLYSGFGLSVLPCNSLFLEAASDVGLHLRNDGGLDRRHDGSVTVEAARSGSRALRTVQMGLMLSLGPVRLPVQVSKSLGSGATSVTGALALAW